MTIGTKYIREFDTSNNSVGFVQNGIGTYYFEFLSDDAGTTISIEDLTRTGIESDYTYASIANGSSSTSLTNVSVISKLIIDSSATALNYVGVAFPSNPTDGQLVTISSTVPVTNLYLFANSNINYGTNVGTQYALGPQSLTGNSHIGFTYVGSPSNPSVNTWFSTRV